MIARASAPSFAQLFTPKLITVFREGYTLAYLRADALAGLTVAIVALPLSMAIAIASGVTPDRGLYTAIVGGFLVSALGGSRFQIGGPAGAFIVLVAATVELHGIDGMILATFLCGLILLAVGFLRLGTYIKYIPYPVTIGFTAGISAIIAVSQLKDLLGLHLAHEPGPIIPKLQALAAALPGFTPGAVAVALFSLAVIIAVRRFRPHWPAFLIAVVLASAGVAAFGLHVETIGSRFGGIPATLPVPHLPVFTIAKITAVLPAAIAFALLGSIESLLSAVVADSMSGARHRSNCELVAQGAANIACALVGGICVTGAIARTATNLRAGARGPVSGMLAALFLLAFLLVAAPLASAIPLATLAALLMVVAWGMAEQHAFFTLLRTAGGDTVVLLATYLLVVFRDLTEGIVVGFSIGALLFLHRMAQSIQVESVRVGAGRVGAGGVGGGRAMITDDIADSADGDRLFDAALAADPDIAVCRISGAFFFGAAGSVAVALDTLNQHPKAYIIDFAAVPMLDSTGAATISDFVRRAARKPAAVYLTGTRTAVRRILLTHGVRPPAVRFKVTIEAAVAAIKAYAHTKDKAGGAEPAPPDPPSLSKQALGVAGGPAVL
jgi:SulP family sulfate permease